MFSRTSTTALQNLSIALRDIVEENAPDDGAMPCRVLERMVDRELRSRECPTCQGKGVPISATEMDCTTCEGTGVTG